MATTQKAIALSRELADRLRMRLSSLTIVESVASDNNPVITIGSGVAGGATAVIKTGPMSWAEAKDHLGNTAIIYAPSVIQLVTEAQPTATLHRQVKVATAAALPACTPAGAGVGHTLTADAVGVLTVDGVATVANDRILVKDQVDAGDNGIYYVSTAGAGGTAFVLTRVTDWDSATGEIRQGTTVNATHGTVNADTAWVLTTSGTIVVDTTDLTFVAVGTDALALTKQQLAHLLGETLGRMAVVEWYESPAGAVPTASFISSTYLVASYKDLFWNIQKSA